MKIGIDTFGLNHSRSGLGSYISSFTSNLPQSDDFYKENKIELFGSEIDRFTYTSGKRISFEGIKLSDDHKAERLWHIMKFKKFVKKQKYDAVIFPLISNCFPIKTNIATVAIVNTVFSSLIEGKSQAERRILKKVVKKSTLIVAATRFIKDDLVQNGIAEEKISVIYNGIDHKLFYPQMESNPEIVDIKPFAIKKPYFIYPSRISGPNKKHLELIKAFELFKKNTGFPHRLVIAGSEDSSYIEEIYSAILKSPFRNDIFVTGHFPHKNFPLLYANSEACIFPSVDEGVGLSVLEAMSTGIPVLCTDKASLSEINKNAFLLINPDDTEQFASSIEKICTDLQMRDKIIKTAIEWSNMFNWEKSVNQTLTLVQNAVSLKK